jgi:hypothetical protein
VQVDDGDACTLDSCDPSTGKIVHEPLKLNDGDDCTFDSCDPKTGPKHQPPPTKYACGACGEGYHAASRAKSARCDSGAGVESFCMPSCGSHFHSCDSRCPSGYEEKSRKPNHQCGPGVEMIFCVRAPG